MSGYNKVGTIREKIDSGQYGEYHFRKAVSATPTGGVMSDLIQGTGFPGPMPLAASTYTAGQAIALDNAFMGAIPINFPVTATNRYLINLGIGYSSSGGSPAMAHVCDFLILYPNININATPTTLDNTVTLPRYTDGVDVMCIAVVTTALTTSAPTLTFTYTDSENNSTSASLRAVTSTAGVSSLFVDNAGLTGFFLPMGSTGRGVKKIDSYTIASGTATGAVSLLLVKLLASVPLSEFSSRTYLDKNFVEHSLSLPKVEDNACLGFLIGPTASLSGGQSFYGKLTYGWN